MKSRGFSLLMAACCLLAYTCAAVWATDDPGWPKERTAADGTKLLVYQPQVDSWEGHRRLQARVAVALTPPQGTKSILGVLWIAADTEVIPTTRTVVLTNLQIVRTNFPTLPPPEASRVTAALHSHFPRGPMNFALDRVLANMALTQE
jgi:hypothetical protein